MTLALYRAKAREREKLEVFRVAPREKRRVAPREKR